MFRIIQNGPLRRGAVLGRNGQAMLYATVLSSVSLPQANAERYFDPADAMLPDSARIDFSAFSKGSAPAGNYHVDVYVNRQFIRSQDIVFKSQDNTDRLEPQLTLQDWKNFGARSPAISNASEKAKSAFFPDPGELIPGASSGFDYINQRLNVSIPQAYMNTRAQNSVDPALWDDGINALLFNYSVNASEGRQGDDNGQSSSLYMNLRPGINVGAWRIRNNTTYTRNVLENDASSYGRNRFVTDKWQSISTYAQRDLPSILSRLTLGESATPGDVFDSFTFTGVKVASEDTMLPDSLRGFAPVVRGVAVSNAQVTVSQGGAVVYQAFVPPGPFALTDIYPTSNGGELNVSIKEADGTVKNFTQPFSSIPGMQREGHLRYSATAGRYRSFYANADEPAFTQGIAQYGLGNDITLYGGSILANQYQSFMGGVSKGFGDFGSVAVDMTHASTTLRNDDKKKGQAYRVQYAKSVLETGTVLSLAAYRYNSPGYFDFAQRNQMYTYDDDSWQWQYSKRTSLQLLVNQSLSDWGNLSASYWQRNYWNADGVERTASLNYTKSWRNTIWNLSLNVTRMPDTSDDNQIALSVQVPLDDWLTGSRARYSVSHSDSAGTTNQVSLSGQLPDNRNVSYSVQQSINRDSRAGGGVYGTWRASAGQLTGGYSYSGSDRQANLSAAGSVIAHAGGVTLGQQFYDNAVLIHAPGADDVDITNDSSITTNRWGYAILPTSSSYRQNRVSLNDSSTNQNIEIKNAVANVVPTNGAVTLANFKTETGKKAFIRLNYHNAPVPLGAEVTKPGDDDNQRSLPDYVGENGNVYLTGLSDTQLIHAAWSSDGADITCTARLNVADINTSQSTIARSSAECK